MRAGAREPQPRRAAVQLRDERVPGRVEAVVVVAGAAERGNLLDRLRGTGAPGRGLDRAADAAQVQASRSRPGWRA